MKLEGCEGDVKGQRDYVVRFQRVGESEMSMKVFRAFFGQQPIIEEEPYISIAEEDELAGVIEVNARPVGSVRLLRPPMEQLGDEIARLRATATQFPNGSREWVLRELDTANLLIVVEQLESHNDDASFQIFTNALINDVFAHGINGLVYVPDEGFFAPGGECILGAVCSPEWAIKNRLGQQTIARWIQRKAQASSPDSPEGKS